MEEQVRSGRVRLYNTRGQWLLAGAAALAFPMLVLRPDPTRPLWWWAVAAAGILALNLVFVSTIFLEYGPDRLRRRVARVGRGRSVDLSALSGIHHSTAFFGVPTVELLDANGGRLGLMLGYRAAGLHRWGPLVIAAAVRNQLNVPPDVLAVFDPRHTVVTAGRAPGPGSPPR